MVEKREFQPNPDEILEEGHLARIETAVNTYASMVIDALDHVRQGNQQLPEVQQEIGRREQELRSQVLADTDPVAGYRTRAAIHRVCRQEYRRFVYDHIEDEAWRDALLEQWWSLDHVEYHPIGEQRERGVDTSDAGETARAETNDSSDTLRADVRAQLTTPGGYGGELVYPTGDEAIEAARTVIDQYGDFDFVPYEVR